MWPERDYVHRNVHIIKSHFKHADKAYALYEFYLEFSSSGDRASREVVRETSFRRGASFKERSMTLTYISGSISVSQQNITKLEREAGRHANQVDKSCVHILAEWDRRMSYIRLLSLAGVRARLIQAKRFFFPVDYTP